MPLKKGKSKKAFSSNVKELIHNYKKKGNNRDKPSEVVEKGDNTSGSNSVLEGTGKIEKNPPIEMKTPLDES